jgi:hypothetical protein
VDDTEPTIGDNVRIRASAETERSGHAGWTGTFYGFTTPSVTGVGFVGATGLDLAYNVGFDNDADAWFAPELVEVVDHAPGSEMTIGDRRFVRSADGEWHPA